jgi:hypothetical protein
MGGGFFYLKRLVVAQRSEGGGTWVCLSCGADYPAGPGVCRGYGEDAHPPRQVVRR